MRSWANRAAFEEPDATTGPPDTIAKAKRLKLSPTVAAMLDEADNLASSDGARLVGLRHLIGAAMHVGEREQGGGQVSTLFAGAFFAAVRDAADPALLKAGMAQPAGAAHELPLSPMAQAAIEQARLFSRLATGEDFLAARHVVTALTFPLRPDLRAALARVWRTRWGIDPGALRPALQQAMEREIAERTAQGFREDRTAWQPLFGTRREAPAFAADAPRPARIDPLGYAEEARRLAELACLAANDPPMAVALFGDWGAGKSTFMNRMQAAVEDIGATWRGEANAPFRTRVAQVRFNAWTYADGDLWASLATEIFRQLKGEIARLSGAPEEAASQYRALLDRVALRIGSAEAGAREALGELARINRDLAARREELTRVEKRGAEIAAAPAAERLRERAARLLAEKPGAVKDALATLGLLAEGASRQADALVGVARESTGALGRARLLLRLLQGMHSDMRVWPWVLAGGAAIMLLPLVPGALGAIAGIAVPLWRRAKPILDAVSAFEQAEAAERASLAARRTTLEAEIGGLRREREAKEAAQTRESAFLARYAGAASGESPAALLRFFLEQDVSLAGYEQRLGLVSRLRESFETLEVLLAEGARGGDGKLPAIDRIILYVDDLDRCQPNQVVPVLQALALMLQLKLFVAVVAVDERWLNAALRIHYRELFAEGAMTSPEQFLEKIFQIPFWLPPLSATDPARYQAFVAHLAPEAVAAAPTAGASIANIEEISEVARKAVADARGLIDPDELPRPGDGEPTALASRADTIDRVSLTEPELALLGALAPLAGGTPRAVKRFVNLYRLIRAARQGPALEAWLGRSGGERTHALLAFALAWQCGADPLLTPPFIAAGPAFDADPQVAALRQATVRELVFARLAGSDQGVSEGLEKQPIEARMRVQQDQERRTLAAVPVGAALRAVAEAFGREPRVADMAGVWAEATRFSFRRPR